MCVKFQIRCGKIILFKLHISQQLFSEGHKKTCVNERDVKHRVTAMNTKIVLESSAYLFLHGDATHESQTSIHPLSPQPSKEEINSRSLNYSIYNFCWRTRLPDANCILSQSY